MGIGGIYVSFVEVVEFLDTVLVLVSRVFFRKQKEFLDIYTAGRAWPSENDIEDVVFCCFLLW